ncbi:hypothetical protein FRC08_016740, partial [Ceratobasidium sp. 394]
ASLTVSLGPVSPTPSPLDPSSSSTHLPDPRLLTRAPVGTIGTARKPGRRNRRTGTWIVEATGPPASPTTWGPDPPRRRLSTDRVLGRSIVARVPTTSGSLTPTLTNHPRHVPRIPHGRNVRLGSTAPPARETEGRLVRPPRLARSCNGHVPEAHSVAGETTRSSCFAFPTLMFPRPLAPVSPSHPVPAHRSSPHPRALVFLLAAPAFPCAFIQFESMPLLLAPRRSLIRKRPHHRGGRQANKVLSYKRMLETNR